MSGNQNFDNQTSYKQTYENIPSTNESLEALEAYNSEVLLKLQKEFQKERASRKRHTFIATTAIIGTILIAANFQIIAAGLIAAAPIIGIVAGSLAALVAVAGVSFLAYKYRAPIIDGFKHAAENAVAGAKSLGSTIVNSTKHAAEKTADGANWVVEKTVSSTKDAVEGVKRSTRSGLKGLGNALRNTGEKIPKSGERPDATDAKSTTSRNNDDVSRRTSIGSVYFDATDAQPTTPEDNSKGAAPKGNILRRAYSAVKEAVKGVTEKLSPKTKLDDVREVTFPLNRSQSF